MKLLAFAFASVGILAAQEPVLPLSLHKAVEIALAPDGAARLAIAREAVAQADAQRLRARAEFLPLLDGSVSYQSVTRNLAAFGIQIPSVPGIPFSIPSFVGPFGIFDARATASLSLLDFASIRRYQAAKAQVEVARRQQDWERSEVADQVAHAYLAALRAEADLAAAQADVTLAEALRKLADSQKAAGTGTGIEVTRADVQLANERQRLQTAETERNRTLLLLLRAMNLDLDAKIQLTDALAYRVMEPVSLEQAVDLALRTRGDWQVQQERERQLRLNHSAIGAERLPSVGVFGDYGAIGAEAGSARPTRAAGVSLRVPVFDGGRRSARRAEAASRLRQEEVRTRDLRKQMELDIRLAFESLRSAELRVRTAEEGLQLASRELEQAQRRYKAGVANSLEVTDAQTRLARARRNRTDALFQYSLARLDLGAATGQAERFLP